MGGTFNPIHYGHLVAAEEALNLSPLDRIIFMPAGMPPHKDVKGIIDAEDRYLMTVIATASNPSFRVSRYEIDKAGPSYTVETMREFAGRHQGVELFFITGVDEVLDIRNWHTPERIFDYGKIIAATRPGYPLESTSDIGGFPASRELSSREALIYIMDIPGVAVSSTEIRERLRMRRSVRYLLPDKVLEYIDERKLYKD